MDIGQFHVHVSMLRSTSGRDWERGEKEEGRQETLSEHGSTFSRPGCRRGYGCVTCVYRSIAKTKVAMRVTSKSNRDCNFRRVHSSSAETSSLLTSVLTSERTSSPLLRLYTFHVTFTPVSCVRAAHVFRVSATVLSLVPRASSWTAAPRAAVRCRAQSASAAPCFRHMLRTRRREVDC